MAAESFLYLVTRGRKSGVPREIEIWFVAHESRYYLVAETRERAGWVKNLRAHAEVAFSLGTRRDKQRDARSTPARARVVDEGETQLLVQVRALMDAKYGWSDGLVVEIAPRS